MTTAILITAAVGLLAYDPAIRLFAKWQKSRKPTRESSDYVIIDDSEPTRLQAFQAAETLTAYFDSIGHASGIATSRAAAQWLFAESDE